MIQKFIPQIKNGDKRIFIINGIIKGAIRRIPKRGSIVSNIGQGGKATKTVLTKQEIKFGNKIINFEIDPFKKKCLLNGLDDISLTLENSEKISSYEENLKKIKPWIN